MTMLSSIVSASFNFLISLFINNISIHSALHFLVDQGLSFYSRYPSLYCTFRSRFLLKMCSIHAVFLFEIMSTRHTFSFLILSIQDMSSICLKIYISEASNNFVLFCQSPLFWSLKCLTPHSLLFFSSLFGSHLLAVYRNHTSLSV